MDALRWNNWGAESNIIKLYQKASDRNFSFSVSVSKRIDLFHRQTKYKFSISILWRQQRKIYVDAYHIIHAISILSDQKTQKT